MQAKSYRKKSNRTMRVAKSVAAAEAIGKIEHGQDVFILTYGQFSLIDALVAIIDQIGPSDVVISTWTAADAHLERSKDLMESAQIKSLRMIVDRSFESRQPDYCYHMRRLFGPECVRAIRTHAKFLLIRSATHDVVCRTSMNLNENPRLENIEVSEGREFAEFFQTVADNIFAEIEIGENASPMPRLDDVPELFPWNEIQATMIPRETMNECHTTHAVRR